MIEITPNLKKNTDKPLYILLYQYIKEQIMSDNIKAEEKLPSIRHLSKYLNISKNTVVAAYEQLMAEGYVESRGQSGIFVGNIQNIIVKKDNINTETESLFASNNDKMKIKFDLRNAQIDVDSFPYTIWRKVLNQCINPDMHELLNYGEHPGEKDLRIQISRYLFLSRGVKCKPEQILIGAGTQQSLSMLSLILRSIGKEIAFEEPGYVGARQVFINNNYDIVPIELEADGINLKELNNCSAKIVYITPSHQFPCGMVMPISKRLMLLQWASEKNGFIIEDDYDGEFRYQGKPIPALQGLDSNGSVIYLGTFSKSLIPAIRISYMVLPEKLLNIYKKQYIIYEQPVSRIDQKALQLFMEQGYWDRHVKRMRNIYKKKHDLLINSINSILGDKVEIIGKDAGLHILLKVNSVKSEEELIKAAYRKGVAVSPTSLYWINKEGIKETLIFIGFGGISMQNIWKSIEIFKEAIES